MSGLCLSALGTTVFLPVGVFTLSWQHSIEKTPWEERWRIEEGVPARLVFVEGRIRGSGAGMEPPPQARLEDGVWVYHADLRLPALHLAHSPFAPEYRLCLEEGCHALDAWLPADADRLAELITSAQAHSPTGTRAHSSAAPAVEWSTRILSPQSTRSKSGSYLPKSWNSPA